MSSEMRVEEFAELFGLARKDFVSVYPESDDPLYCTQILFHEDQEEEIATLNDNWLVGNRGHYRIVVFQKGQTHDEGCFIANKKGRQSNAFMFRVIKKLTAEEYIEESKKIRTDPDSDWMEMEAYEYDGDPEKFDEWREGNGY